MFQKLSQYKHAAVSAALLAPFAAFAVGEPAIATTDIVETITNQKTAIAAVAGAFMVLTVLKKVWGKLGGR